MSLGSGKEVVKVGLDWEPAYFVRGHRGRVPLWIVTDSWEQALAVCAEHDRMGYVHLRIHALHCLAGEAWQPWMRHRVAPGVVRG